MTDQFSNPASSAGIEWTAVNGHLLLVSPHSQEHGIVTAYGPADAVRADITDLDAVDPNTGLPFVYEDILVFPKVLQSQLRPKFGGKVLGRLGQGAAKQGQDPPWTLADFTPQDAQRATAYLAHIATLAMRAPAADPWASAPAAPPQQAPVYPPPAPAPTAPPAAPPAQGWSQDPPF